MAKTLIEWATHTINWQAGCTKVSPACFGCYALEMSRRLAHMGPDRYKGTVEDITRTDGDGVAQRAGCRWTGAIHWDPEAMRRGFQPLQNGRLAPRRVFLGSMTDLFHEASPPAALEALAKAIRTVHPVHRVMLLTKRPERLLAWQRRHFPGGLPETVWVGVTAEDMPRTAERVPILLEVKASVRFLSCEPLLDVVKLTSTELDGLHWIIAGGESGPKARPTNPEWAISLRDQAESAGVAFFFKQWGAWAPEWAEFEENPALPPGSVVDATTESGAKEWIFFPDPAVGLVGDTNGTRSIRAWNMSRVGKKAAGRLLEGRIWNEFPSHPAAPLVVRP